MKIRRFIISGASSGIGKAITETLLAEGHDVVGLARDWRKFTPDSQAFTPVSLDFSDLDQLPEQLVQLQTSLARDEIPVSGLICCAGQGIFKSLEEFSYRQIRSLMDLNFTSQAFLIRAFLPTLKKNTSSDIILMSSIAGLRGDRKGTIYSASKFALRGFAQALRDECGRAGVKVTVVNPGMVDTPFFDALNFKPGEEANQHIKPADIAQQIAAVLSLRPGCSVDELTISALTKVIEFKK